MIRPRSLLALWGWLVVRTLLRRRWLQLLLLRSEGPPRLILSPGVLPASGEDSGPASRRLASSPGSNRRSPVALVGELIYSRARLV